MCSLEKSGASQKFYVPERAWSASGAQFVQACETTYNEQETIWNDLQWTKNDLQRARNNLKIPLKNRF